MKIMKDMYMERRKNDYISNLKEIRRCTYEYRQSSLLEIREELKKQGIQMKEPSEVTLESEYEKLKALDIDEWKNKRVPRPWEGTENED